MTTAESINDLRREILAGEEVSDDRLRAAINALVGERLRAHTAEPKAKKAPAVKVDLGDLLG